MPKKALPVYPTRFSSTQLAKLSESHKMYTQRRAEQRKNHARSRSRAQLHGLNFLNVEARWGMDAGGCSSPSPPGHLRSSEIRKAARSAPARAPWKPWRPIFTTRNRKDQRELLKLLLADNHLSVDDVEKVMKFFRTELSVVMQLEWAHSMLAQGMYFIPILATAHERTLFTHVTHQVAIAPGATAHERTLFTHVTQQAESILSPEEAESGNLAEGIDPVEGTGAAGTTPGRKGARAAGKWRWHPADWQMLIVYAASRSEVPYWQACVSKLAELVVQHRSKSAERRAQSAERRAQNITLGAQTSRSVAESKAHDLQHQVLDAVQQLVYDLSIPDEDDPEPLDKDTAK
eukprot:gene2810-3607_t